MEIMEEVVIEAELRTVTGKKVGVLRREGKLPGVIYGHKVAPTPIVMDLHVVSRQLSVISQSHIVTISVDGKKHAALVREKQRDFIRGTLKHVDFQVVSLTEKIRTHVTIEFTGLAPAIKNFNGVVVTEINQVEVEAFPNDLPDKFVVDLSKLENLGDAVYVKDLDIPAKVTLFTEENDVIVVVTGVEEEKVEEAVEEGAAEPEVIERGKKEEVEEEE